MVSQANSAPKVRLGTRGSPLALAQAREVRRRLMVAHAGMTESDIEIVVIRTSGDRIQDRALAEVGGKGLFTKEIEEALLDSRIDFAVHSMKDMPTVLPAGLVIAAILPREDPRDVLIAPRAKSVADLPKGAKVGTASLRRKAQLLHRRPDLKVVMIRGNVETRLRKIEAGEVDATLLALAGLKRLGLADRAKTVLDSAEMLPAVAQGAIGLECRDLDAVTRALLAPLNDAPSAACVAAERAFLMMLDGSCRTPIAALAELRKGRLRIRGAVIRGDGSERLEATREGPVAHAQALGAEAGAELRVRIGPGFYDDH